MAKNYQKLPLSLHYASYLHPISPRVLSQQRQHFQSLAKTASSKPQDICRSKKTKRLPNRPRQRPSPPQLPQLPPLLQLLPSYLRLCYRDSCDFHDSFFIEVMEMTWSNGARRCGINKKDSDIGNQEFIAKSWFLFAHSTLYLRSRLRYFTQSSGMSDWEPTI